MPEVTITGRLHRGGELAPGHGVRYPGHPIALHLSADRRSVCAVDLDDMPFDPMFDFPAEAERLAGKNGDPDKDSPTMRYYHQRLWSGRLTGLKGNCAFSLTPAGAGLKDTALGRSFFGSESGLYLSSDRAIPKWRRKGATRRLRDDAGLMGRILAARPVLEYMGAIMMFPGHRIDGRQTINGAKGFHPKIADRLDLTVECIRLAYVGVFDHESNRLGPVLERYWDFFNLFDGFSGYVDFWLLNDLLTPDGQRIDFFLEGDIDKYDFSARGPLPTTVEEYDHYLDRAVAFTLKRNDRMVEAWH